MFKFLAIRIRINQRITSNIWIVVNFKIRENKIKIEETKIDSLIVKYALNLAIVVENVNKSYIDTFLV